MRTLALTSPFMRGSDVVQAQRRLHAAGFLTGKDPIDGVFGPASVRAARRAHYWLGFGGKLTNAPTYGDTLDKILQSFITKKDAGLPLLYRLRRAARIRAAAKPTLGARALAWLAKHVGETELPAGSNRVPWASEWYGLVGPWCAMALTRAYVEAGSKTFARGIRYAYVPYIVADATYGRNRLARTFTPRAGDLVCFDWNGDTIHDHVELVEVAPKIVGAGATFRTIGANTSSDDSGDQSNGGGVYRRTRVVLPANRTIFVRVGG